MALSSKGKFATFVAVPVAVLAIAGASAFTFGQDVSQINGSQEQVDYLVVATNTTSTDNLWTMTNYIGDNPTLTSTDKTATINTKYGELPQWFQVNTGAIGVPSAVQEAGDLLFINPRSSTTSDTDTNNGLGGAGGAFTNDSGADQTNVVQAIHVKGNITNVAALRQTYATCLIPIRLWVTADGGDNFTDITRTYLDTQARTGTGTNEQTASTTNPNSNAAANGTVGIAASGSGVGNPFYVDCTTGEFEFTVPTAQAVAQTSLATLLKPDGHSTVNDFAYEVSIERGGVFSTFNNNTGAQPEFVFQSTPLTYDPTNQFNVPNSTPNNQGNGVRDNMNGNGQYTPNCVQQNPTGTTVQGCVSTR